MAANIATRESWKALPFDSLAPFAYHAKFTRDEYAILRRGLIPAAMEDKWFIFWEADSLFFHRSWTGHGVYRVDFQPSGDQFEAVQAFIATEGQQYQQSAYSYEAALLDFLIRGLLLQQSVEFPLPPGLPTSAPTGLYQHHIAGTGFPERTLAGEQGRFLSRLKHWLRL